MQKPESVVSHIARRTPTRLMYSDETGATGRVEWVEDDYSTACGCDLAEIAKNFAGIDPKSMVATRSGMRPACDLRPGDRVLTRDDGEVEVRWTTTLRLGWRDLGLLPVLAPVRIRAGAFGAGLPMSELIASQGQRIVVPDAHAEDAAACVVGTLQGRDGVEIIHDTNHAEYQLIVLAKDGLILCGGIWCGTSGANVIPRDKSLNRRHLESDKTTADVEDASS